MRVRQTRLAPPAAGGRAGARAFARLALASLACLACHGAAGAQQREAPKPTRFFTVEGRVSLPDERAAAGVRVSLTGRGGVNRVALTSDSGRYEFRELPPGVYSVAAESISEPTYAAGPSEADTAYAGTGRLTVNLSLRAPAAAAAGDAASRKPATLSVAEATQRVPKEARRAFERGVKLRRQGRSDEALASLTRAVESFPDYFQALSERGDLLVSRREMAAAAADFERALGANDRYEPALRGAGYCKLEARDFAGAAEYLGRAAAADPARAGTHLLLGVALLELGRRDEARRSLQQALKIDAAGASRARVHLANLYARERRFREAADELRLYLETAVADPEAPEMRKVEARWRALARDQ
jgi:tetratricopeptide (TPR) repeat protein